MQSSRIFLDVEVESRCAEMPIGGACIKLGSQIPALLAIIGQL